MYRKLSRSDAVRIIEDFVDGSSARFEFDDFLCGSYDYDDLLKEMRDRCDEVEGLYPPDRPGWFCNEAGLKELRKLAQRLREAM